MDKDIKVCNKKQTNPHKNIIEYDIFNKDKNYILSLLSIEYGLSFEGEKCVQTDSIAIHKNGASWFVKKFNETKYPNLPPYANFEGIIFALTSHLQGKEKLNAQRAIIDRCTGFSLPTANNLPEKQPKPRQSPKNGLNVEFCELKKDVLDYFAAKGGITKGTLDRYGTKSARKINGYTQYYPSFGWVVGDNTKIKRPKHKEKKYLQTKGKQPYIFGFEQLPTQGETLLICAGETDTLCINEHCNGHGVWAVCLSSENDLTTLNDSLVNELKTRFKRVFIVYDADETGYKYSRELSLKTGFIWVNTALYLVPEKCKDICELWAAMGAEMVRGFVGLATSQHTRINAVETDKFSIDVPFVYRCEFDKYLGEDKPLLFIKELLLIEPKLAIQSPAGTGKSTMLLELCRKGNTKLIIELCKGDKQGKNYIETELGLTKTIIVVPTTSLGEQLQKSFAKSGLVCGFVWGSENSKLCDVEAERNEQTVIVVYDSLPKLSEFITNCFLVVDEFHQIANDYDYRQKSKAKTGEKVIVMHNVWQAIQNAPNVMLLSATPNHLFCSHLTPFFNFALVVGEALTTNKIHTKFIGHSVSKKHIIDYVEENAPKNKGTICVKFNNNTTLTAYHSSDKKRGIVSDHFTSKDKARKQDNRNYISIMETGAPVEKLDKLYYTPLLEAGVSFLFPVSVVAIFDEKSWSRIIQLSTRPRLYENFGVCVNEQVDIYVFFDNKNKDTYTNGQTLAQRWAYYFECAQKECEALNGKGGGTITHRTSIDFRTYCHSKDGVYSVNIPAILHELYLQETRETDIQTLANRIARFDKRFTYEIIDAFTNENADINEALDILKAQKKQAQSEFLTLLSKEPTNTIYAVLRQLKDVDFKAHAKDVLGLPLIDKSAVLAHAQNNALAMQNPDKTRIVKDLVWLVGELGLSLQNAIKEVTYKTKKDIQFDRDRYNLSQAKKTYKEAPEQQSPETRLQLEKHKAICLKFNKILNNIQQGKRKNEFTTSDLAAIANAALNGVCVTFGGKTHKIATPKKLSEKTVIGYLDKFYLLERYQPRFNEHGKQTSLYKIFKK